MTYPILELFKKNNLPILRTASTFRYSVELEFNEYISMLILAYDCTEEHLDIIEHITDMSKGYLSSYFKVKDAMGDFRKKGFTAEELLEIVGSVRDDLLLDYCKAFSLIESAEVRVKTQQILAILSLNSCCRTKENLYNQYGDLFWRAIKDDKYLNEQKGRSNN